MVLDLRLEALVGRLAVRRVETALGGNLFLCEPVFVLSYAQGIAIVSMVDTTSSFDVGTIITLPDDYLDDAWLDYGSVVNAACVTKAQVIVQLLSILGIVADKQSLKALCKAVTYKQLLSEISSSLDLDDLLYAMSEDTHTVEEPIAPGTSWAMLQQGGNFVRRRFS